MERVDILGPGKDDARSLMRDHLSGVDVAIHTEQGSLDYELKVPLKHNSDYPYGIETAAREGNGIGFETGKLAEHLPARAAGAESAVAEWAGAAAGAEAGTAVVAGGGGGEGRSFQPPKPMKAGNCDACAGPAR